MKTRLILSAIISTVVAGHAQLTSHWTYYESTPEDQKNGKPMVEVVYEVFSLDRAEAAASQRGITNDANLYAKLLAGIKSGKVKQEKLLAVRGWSGDRVATEHISELFYPTEFDPPELPNAIGIAVDAPALQKEKPPAEEVIDALSKGPGWSEGNFPATPATGTALEMARLGDLLEVESIVPAQKGSKIQIRFAAEHVGLAGMEAWGDGLAEVKMPIFVRKKISSSAEVNSGVPSLVGTVSPPGGGFGDEDDKKRNTVWFAFVTATIVVVGK